MEQTKNLAELGEELIEKGNYKEGVEVAKRLIRQSTGAEPLILELSKRIAEAGEFEHAEILLKSLISKSPSVNGYIYLARLMKSAKNVKRALRAYELAFEFNNSAEYEVCIEAARYAKSVKDDERAFKFYYVAFTKKKESFETLNFLGEYSFVRSRYKEALSYYAYIIKFGYANHEHYRKAGIALYETGDFEHSAKMTEKSIELSPYDEKHKEYAKRLREKKLEDLYPNAEEKCKEIESHLERNSADSGMLYDLGNIYLIKGDYAKAAKAFEDAKAEYLKQN